MPTSPTCSEAQASTIHDARRSQAWAVPNPEKTKADAEMIQEMITAARLDLLAGTPEGGRRTPGVVYFTTCLNPTTPNTRSTVAPSIDNGSSMVR